MEFIFVPVTLMVEPKPITVHNVAQIGENCPGILLLNVTMIFALTTSLSPLHNGSSNVFTFPSTLHQSAFKTHPFYYFSPLHQQRLVAQFTLLDESAGIK